MKNLALITGASGGIGLELAKIHAEKGGDLVLVARSSDKLDAIKAELEQKFGCKVLNIVADLTKMDEVDKVYETTLSHNLEVDILINNAGFGGHGKFHERDLDKDLAMMQLNMMALVALTHKYLQGMVARKSGKVLHLASSAGFLPGPLQATYYATKAFVVSFSQAIAEELKDSGVTSTALCPGPVETDFAKSGDLEDVSAFKDAASPSDVAKAGYEAMLNGELIKFNDAKLSFLLNGVMPFLPRKTILKLSRQSMEKN